MTTTPWELYHAQGQDTYQQPPRRDGSRINHDLLAGTLDDVRAEAFAAHTAEAGLRAKLERATMAERADAIYTDIAEYAAMLELTGWPGGMKLKIIPDGVDPSTSKESDAIDGILWPLTDSEYMNNKAPHTAIGPDRRLYVCWMWGKDSTAKTYDSICYAPLDLYNKRNWPRIDVVRSGIDNLALPVESTLETPPAGAIERCGTTPPADLDAVREQAMTAYEAEKRAKEFAAMKPIDDIYADAALLVSLLQEAGWPGLEKCNILPDGANPKNPRKDQLIPAALFPLIHDGETLLKDTPSYMLGPEGRIYEIWVNGYSKATRQATYHYYVPLDLYADKNQHHIAKIIEGLKNATTAMY